MLVTGGCSLIQRQQFPADLSLKHRQQILLYLAVILNLSAQAPIAVGDADAFAIMQNITKDNRTERTITWLSRLLRRCRSQYREQGQRHSKKLMQNKMSL